MSFRDFQLASRHLWITNIQSIDIYDLIISGVVYDLSNMLLISKISLKSKDLESNYIPKPNSLLSCINLPSTSVFSELSLYLNETLGILTECVFLKSYSLKTILSFHYSNSLDGFSHYQLPINKWVSC